MLWAVRGRRNWHCVIFFSGPEDETVSLVSFPKSDGWDLGGGGYWPLGFQKTFLLLSLFFPSLLKFVKTAKSKKELYFETWSLEYY